MADERETDELGRTMLVRVYLPAPLALVGQILEVVSQAHPEATLGIPEQDAFTVVLPDLEEGS